MASSKLVMKTSNKNSVMSDWAAYAAAVWSFLYGVLGLYWALGGAGFPFGENDARGHMMGSFLSHASADAGGMIIALVGIFSAGLALASVKVWRSRWISTFLLAYAWTMCFVLIVAIPDTRMIQNVAYAFMLHFHLMDWPVINQILCMVGGVLWGAAAMSYWRRMRAACGACGRVATAGAAFISINRLGKWVTWLAAIFALPYGIVRWAWAAGYPLGASDHLLIADQTISNRLVEFVLGGLPIGGAVLTLGFIMRWGEAFPRWCLFLAGKRVPTLLAVIPAAFIAALMTNAGLKISPVIISGIMKGSINGDNWGEMGPTLFWLPWGIALGMATIAYYIRRRGRCRQCGRL
ncbi:hypothetical protein [Paenibacillus spongiae]|uniref:Uncharacterized protein n=1 Tax=Paenibacillus spongiae TaxID=2909671 RepID=A0ABY5S7V6_9BACL|nr:hypothetical protein [Paenibacillus spongiae]UVI29603.1 hypothetical protein L1F29_30005 [Paenibacillus spongiae]